MSHSRWFWGLAVVLGLAVMTSTAISLVDLARNDDGRSYEPSDVAVALRAQGLDVESTIGAGAVRLLGSTFMGPVDGSFTVVVLPSDREARNSFVPYEADTDPETFELRAGNVIILADYSNSKTPLPSETRRRIRSAVAALEAN